MKKFINDIPKFIFFFWLLLPGFAVWGQTTIFEEAGGNYEPINWTFDNNVNSQPIQQSGAGGYWLLEAGDPSDIITTTSYDLSAYTSATFEIDLATYGSGANNPAKIEISYDGGNTFTETHITTAPTSTSYIHQSVNLSNISSAVKIRVSNNGITEKGVRTKNWKLIASTDIPSSFCFFEDFSSIINGNNTTTGGSGTPWSGNANFPTLTVINAYQAGGAVRIGTSGAIGSIQSKTLNDVSGNITVRIMVKGWTTVEGDLKVSIDGQEEILNYTAVMVDPFEEVSVNFLGIAAGSKLKIETTAKRAFIDQVEIDCITPSNYFRTRQTGDWTSVSTWQKSTNGISWSDSDTYPGLDAVSVEIRNTHTVTLDTDAIFILNTKVEASGSLNATTHDFILTGNNYALTIKNGGQFIIDGSAKPALSSNSEAKIEPGGIFKVVSFSNSNNFVSNYLDSNNPQNRFKFGNNSIFSWNAGGGYTLGAQATEFFKVNPGDLVIFKMIQTFSPTDYGSNTINRFHAVLELPDNRSLNLQGNGDKIFEGGITGNGTLNVAYSSGSGKLVFGNTTGTAAFGSAGNLKLIVPHDKLQLQNIEVPAGAGVTIESNGNSDPNTLTRTAGDISIKGVLDITDMRITNTADGGIFVRNGGTLRTKFTGGLFGGGSAIVNDSNFTMDTGSTIDYYATDNQTISSGKEYYHLIFSGAAIKTPQNATGVNTNGSVTITGTPTVNYTNFNLASTSGNGTDFTMDGGKLIIGTGGTQPRPGGTYSITGGTIEFTGNSVTSIRVTPEYYNIMISGQKKKPGGTGFKINNVLSVTTSGELTIPSTPDDVSSHVVTAHKGVQVANGGKLTFENNAQLMQDAAGVTNSGNITAERLFTFSAGREQYNFVMSPVEGQNIKQIFESGNIPYALVYNEATDFFVIPGSYTEKRGYAIKEVEGSGATQMTAGFTGGIRNGTVTMDLTKAGQGFNLVGNPYPSNLDIHQLYVDNSSKINPTFYFWDNRANDLFEQMGAGYDGYYQDQYAKYNAASGTGSPATHTGGMPRIPNQYAKIGTGFMVQATGNGTLSFNNNQRSTVNNSPGFFGKGHNDEEKDRYWLTLTSPAGISVMNAVVYFDGGKDDFWIDDTGTFGPSDDLYSIAENHQLAIQGREPFRINDEVPLGYRAFEEGIYVISLYQKEGIFENGQDIYLVDRLLGRIVNLSETPYKFRTEAGEFNSRFRIIYKDRLVRDVILQARNEIGFAKRGNRIEITSNIDKLTEVEIFDLSSRPVFKQTGINRNSLSVDAVRLNHQILIIRARTETGEEVSRKFVFD